MPILLSTLHGKGRVAGHHCTTRSWGFCAKMRWLRLIWIASWIYLTDEEVTLRDLFLLASNHRSVPIENRICLLRSLFQRGNEVNFHYTPNLHGMEIDLHSGGQNSSFHGSRIGRLVSARGLMCLREANHCLSWEWIVSQQHKQYPKSHSWNSSCYNWFTRTPLWWSLLMQLNNS